MKEPFAVGDRVRVIISAGDVQDGTIKSECPGGWKVELDDPADIVTMDADPRQMRRLVKRKPAREWWIHESRWKTNPPHMSPDTNSWDEWFMKNNEGYIRTERPKYTDGWTLVREVRPKK